MTKKGTLVSDVKVFEHIQKTAKLWIPRSKILLFGSRARGDHSDLSDFDLSVQLDETERKNWSAFCASLREKSPTLHTFDVIDFGLAEKKLQDRILIEGSLIYDGSK